MRSTTASENREQSEREGETEMTRQRFERDDREGRRRLLVPIDGSDPSLAALEHACSTRRNAEVVAFHAVHPSRVDTRGSNTGEPESDFEAIKRMRERERQREIERMFEEAKELAACYGVELSTMTVVGRPTRAIVTYGEEHDVDRIVIGSRGRSGPTRILLGSVAEAVVRRASIPITVVPARREAAAVRSKASRVLVPTDGSLAATKALTYALETFPDAAFTVVHVVDPTEGYVESLGWSLRRADRWHDETRNRTGQILENARRLADECDVECATVTLTGPPSRAIVSCAEERGVDQIVIGSRDRSSLTQALSRSVSESVVRRSSVPVTILR